MFDRLNEAATAIQSQDWHKAVALSRNTTEACSRLRQALDRGMPAEEATTVAENVLDAPLPCAPQLNRWQRHMRYYMLRGFAQV